MNDDTTIEAGREPGLQPVPQPANPRRTAIWWALLALSFLLVIFWQAGHWYRGWLLAELPGQGREASIGKLLFLFQGAGLTIVLLLTGLVYLVINRQARLTMAVRGRTRQIARLNGQLQSELTERRRAEQKLRFQAKLLDSVRESVVATDLEGRVLYWGKGAEALYGYPAEEVIGQHITFIVEPHEELEEEERMRLVRANGSWRGEYEQKRREGSSFWADTFISLVTDEHERPQGLIGIDRDITTRKDIEAELRAERDFSAAVLDTIGALVVVLDRKGRIVRFNRACEKTTGYAFEEVHDRYVWEIFLIPEEIETARAVFRDVQSGQFPRKHEDYWVTKEGERRLIAWTNTVLLDDQGSAEYIIATGIDTTEGKRAAREIRRRNRELNLLNQVIAASAAGQAAASILETVCRELALAFGVPRATAALLNDSNTAAEVMAEYLAEGPPSTPHYSIPVAGNPSFQDLLRTKSPLFVADAQRDPGLPSVRAMARLRGIVSMLILPLVVEDKVVGALGLGTLAPRLFSDEETGLAQQVADQIASALTRARLNEERRRLSTAIEQATESVIITARDGTILYVNPGFERTSGYRRAEVIGQNPRLLKSGTQAPAFYENMWATVAAGQVWRGRIVNKSKFGQYYTVDTTITAVRDGSGTITNYIGLQRDVTRELELEAQYRQAQRMEAVGELAAGIAHDFNNLLTAINGFAALLKGELSPDDPSLDLVEKILRSGRRAANLVRQLLVFSRKPTSEPQVVDLNDLVSKLDTKIRRTIGNRIELQTSLAPDLWPVKADPAQIEQVIVDLALNARDAMSDGGLLIIETANVVLDEAYIASRPEAMPVEHVMLAVSDNGYGMSAEVKARIFEPFFTTKEVGQGTGLGLATVYGVVKQSGGDIWVDSEAHEGTTFKIYLPRTVDVAPPAAPQI